MQVRAYLSPNLSDGKSARAGADRDLILLITHDQTEAGRDAEAIRRVVEALVAVFDPETRKAALMARLH
jgi:hypothetical protein